MIVFSKFVLRSSLAPAFPMLCLWYYLNSRLRREGFHGEVSMSRIRSHYFQLQLGMSAPGPVRGCLCVPSASMLQILMCSARPSEEFAYTICRPSGDQEGKSHRPPSCVSWIHFLVATSMT